MAAAWALAHAPEPPEITVYQMGWRLGGKGASGRNLDPAYYGRIEEHGVHMWSGLYDNAFRLIRQAYDELGRTPDAPLGTWRDAFKPHDFIVLEEQWRDQWLPWAVRIPTNGELPGNTPSSVLPSLYGFATEAVRWIVVLVQQACSEQQADLADKTGEPFAPINQSHPSALALALEALAVHLATDLAKALRPVWEAVMFLLKGLLEAVWALVKNRLDETGVRRFWMLINFAYGNVAGVVADDVLGKGFNQLDGQDYAAWLSKHLIDDGGLTLRGPWTLFLYDAEFAYLDGDTNQPDLAAGVALKTLVRMAFTWKGALLWKMQAGMGDTIFAPLYLALQKRGVKFRFFQRVQALELDAAQKNVERIRLGVQANTTGEYQPLVEVNGLPCWPSTTLWDQITAPTDRSINFEDPQSPVLSEDVLTRGAEFDEVVLGIPVGALKELAPQLIAASPTWQRMVEQVRTVRTQALQLWLGPTAYQLGWTRMGRPLMAGFHASPLNTWADMSHLLPREAWPYQAGRCPLDIAYFCGPQLETPDPEAEVRRVVLALLEKSIGWLWPASVQVQSDPTSPIRWEVLIDDRPVPGVGPARLEAQYLRANYWPSERFTLSQHGAISARISPLDPGFDNLTIAGDWTNNTFNIGNVEATVMSGLLASHRLTGYPTKEQIVGLDFGEPGER
jgi:uncharacterized protein with NAD-binding domain and iron-sulfur cluster